MRVTVFSVLISLALPLFAQNPNLLTLDDYLGLVIKHNIDIQQYRDRASRAYTSFLLEDSAFSPLLDFRSSQTISSSETDGTRLETNAFTNRLDLSKRFRSTQGTLHVQYGLNRYHDNVLSGSAVEDEDINSSLSINYSQPLLRDLIGLNTFQARVLRAELNQKQTYQRYIQERNTILLRAVNYYARYSQLTVELGAFAQALAKTTDLIDFISTQDNHKDEQSRLDLINVKHVKQRLVDERLQVEERLIIAKYQLLTLLSVDDITHPALVELGFNPAKLPRYNDDALDLILGDSDDLREINRLRTPSVLINLIASEIRTLGVREAKNNALPDLTLNTEVSYRDTDDDSRLTEFNAPYYRIGARLLLPLVNKPNQLKIEGAKLDQAIAKAIYTQSQIAAVNNAEAGIQALQKKRQRIVALGKNTELSNERLRLEITRYKTLNLLPQRYYDWYFDRTEKFQGALYQLLSDTRQTQDAISAYYLAVYGLRYPR